MISCYGLGVPPAFVDDFGQMAVADPPPATLTSADSGVDLALADLNASNAASSKYLYIINMVDQ